MNTKSKKIPSRQKLLVNDKFVYCESIYKLWKNGASLVREKRYSSNAPITKLSKEQSLKVFPDYKLVRFFDLEEAPENYLINNGYEARHC